MQILLTISNVTEPNVYAELSVQFFLSTKTDSYQH